MRRPGLDGVFGVPPEPGVCEALRGEGDLAGMIHPTGTDTCRVLPAGRCDRQAMAALANGGAGPLFKQLREKYDFVIIDSSPILPVADTRFVSQHADTVVLSVFRDVSEVPKIQATCEILDAFGVRDLEAVVTGGRGFSYGRGRQYLAGGNLVTAASSRQEKATATLTGGPGSGIRTSDERHDLASDSAAVDGSPSAWHLPRRQRHEESLEAAADPPALPGHPSTPHEDRRLARRRRRTRRGDL